MYLPKIDNFCDFQEPRLFAYDLVSILNFTVVKGYVMPLVVSKT